MGGAGADHLLFSAQSGLGTARDTICDFTAGDDIDLGDIGITGLLRGAGGTQVLIDYTGDRTAGVELFVRGSHRQMTADFLF